MRIVSGACDAIHAVVESDNRAVAYRSLQPHVIHTFLGCLGAGEVPFLGVSDFTEEDDSRVLTIAHGAHPSCKYCKSIVIR